MISSVVKAIRARAKEKLTVLVDEQVRGVLVPLLISLEEKVCQSPEKSSTSRPYSPLQIAHLVGNRIVVGINIKCGVGNFHHIGVSNLSRGAANLNAGGVKPIGSGRVISWRYVPFPRSVPQLQQAHRPPWPRFAHHLDHRGCGRSCAGYCAQELAKGFASIRIGWLFVAVGKGLQVYLRVAQVA